MSPEQVRGNSDEIGPQSDVYSMGVVLYEMLTGVVPFRGKLMSVLHRLIHEPPEPPSTLREDLPPDSPLERICLRMLAKEKRDRYATITEVLADVNSIVARVTVAAPPPKRVRFAALRRLFSRPAALVAVPDRTEIMN
jgi:serine/threonine protein kinase